MRQAYYMARLSEHNPFTQPFPALQHGRSAGVSGACPLTCLPVPRRGATRTQHHCASGSLQVVSLSQMEAKGITGSERSFRPECPFGLSFSSKTSNIRPLPKKPLKTTPLFRPEVVLEDSFSSSSPQNSILPKILYGFERFFLQSRENQGS